MRLHKGNLKAQRARRTARARTFRTQWFLEHGPCKMCGSWENLALDHIVRLNLSSRRKRPSALLWEWATPRRNSELAKCQTLCVSCHRKKTAIELRKYDHGLNLYRRHGCRCSVCRAASTAHRRIERKRKSCRIAFALKPGV